MNAKFGVLIIGMLFVLISGCVGLPETIPNDLEIEYNWGACHRDEGWHTLKINSSGDANLEVSEGIGGIFKKQKSYSFTDDELLEVYREIIRNNFFELKENYPNPNVRDGGCSNLRVKAKGKEHKVSNSNWPGRQIDEIENITKKILEILESKDSDWKRIDTKEICNNAKLACKTNDSFQGFSCNLWNYTCEGIRK